MLLRVVSIMVGWALVAGAAPPPAEPLAELDASFRAAYASARAEACNRQGPVLVVAGDKLLCYRDQDLVAEAVIRPALYHSLKTLAHVPLALLLLARPSGTGPLAPEGAKGLETLRARLQAARKGLAQAFPGEAGLLRQQGILKAALALLDQALARGRFAPGEMDAFCDAMRTPIQGNIQEAAALELEALGRVVPAWRRGPLGADWGAVRVVVIGSHMARDQEVSWQYFTRLFGETREGGRLVFAEEKWDPKGALALLASHRLDGVLGEAFFGDPWRLHRDVLGDAAEKWLETHPPVR